MDNQDNIINGISTAWGLILKAVPAIAANPLAAVVYSLFTFGLKTAFDLYKNWKAQVLAQPITVPLISVPPDPDTVKKYLGRNPDYYEAFQDELADFENNEIFLSNAYITLHQLERSERLRSTFAHLMESKNYKAFVLTHERLSEAQADDPNLYDQLRSTLEAIQQRAQAKAALDQLFKTIQTNLNEQIIRDENFWKNLRTVLG